MISVAWTARALTDLRPIRTYLAQLDPYAAVDVAASLLAACDTLSRLPQRGRLVIGAPSDMRELVADDNYIIRYRVVGDEVVILRVRHGARHPTRP